MTITKPIRQPQADALLLLLQHGGLVPTSEWTTGYGQHTRHRSVPPHAALRGDVRREFDRLVKARPRVREVVAITDLRGARRALRAKAEG